MASYLLLLTNTYPYGEGEPFIGTELPYLVPSFDHVIVVSSQVVDAGNARALPLGVDNWPVEAPTTRGARIRSFLAGAVRAATSGSFGRLGGSIRNLPVLRVNAAFEARAQSCWAQVLPKVDALGLRSGDEVTVYSYWLHHTARLGELMATRIRRTGAKVRLVSRAHGYDLYPERHPTGTLPQRDELVAACDAVYPVSTPGQDYLRKHHPQHAPSIQVRHLGTKRPDTLPSLTRERLHVRTCATVTPVKRLECVPSVVEEVARRGVDVVWTHVGGGPGLPDLRQLVERTNQLAEVRLLGALPSEEVLRSYTEHPSTVFLSLSSSEGVPVSMMEAISMGIPIVSTDVGGIRDIVEPDVSGVLLGADFTDSTAADALLRIWTLSDDDYADLCSSARGLWEERFRADVVYSRFVDDLRIL